MNYKSVVAYIPDTSVLFELPDGNFALVSVGDSNLITTSKLAESYLRVGGFENGRSIPEKILSKAAEILEKEENVFSGRE